MEGTEPGTPGRAGEAAPARPGSDGRLLLLLLLLAGGLRAWVICRTEVVSRDGIVFISYARQLEHDPWKKVLKSNHQHPGYPAVILAVSEPVRWLLGTTDAAAMQLSAQLASALAGLLLVFPMFYLGKELFDRGVGFWAALLFQCLPVSGRILSDALSEALFFLLVTTALLCAVRALRSGGWAGFAGCGALSGLAYLTRPEGAVVVLAGGILLVAMQIIPAWRRGWRWTLSRGAALALAAGVVGSPIPIITHQFSPKPSTHQTVVKAGALESREAVRPAPQAPREGQAPVLTAGVGRQSFAALAVWLNRQWSLSQRLGHGLQGVGFELVKGFHYFGWLPALLGLWWHRRELRRRPEWWLLAILCLLFGAILCRLAVAASYVSERHVLLLVLCGLFPAVVGLRELPARLAAGRYVRWAPAWSVALLLLLAGSGLPKTLQSLHANRVGHLAAGRWLAQHAGPQDDVLDGHFGWARFYSEADFLERRRPKNEAPTCYIIKGRSLERRNPYGPTNSQADYTLEQIKEAQGKPAYTWPVGSPADRADVIVWAVNAARLKPPLPARP